MSMLSAGQPARASALHHSLPVCSLQACNLQSCVLDQEGSAGWKRFTPIAARAETPQATQLRPSALNDDQPWQVGEEVQSLIPPPPACVCQPAPPGVEPPLDRASASRWAPSRLQAPSRWPRAPPCQLQAQLAVIAIGHCMAAPAPPPPPRMAEVAPRSRQPPACGPRWACQAKQTAC